MSIQQIELWRTDDAWSRGAGLRPSPPGPLSLDAQPSDICQPHGMWMCELTTQTLRWTPGVFDLFGLPRHTRLDRRMIVEMYCDQSREEMEWLRAEGIARCTGFSLEAEIQQADGTRRWMLLTTRVHCRNGRPTHIYGRKRDITDMHLARLRDGGAL